MNASRENKTQNWEFRLDSIENFRSLCGQLGCKIELIEDVSILAEPVRAGNVIIPNSLAVNPMEGADGQDDGSPGRLTVRRYKRFAAGGAGLLWAEAIAVVPEGRANPRQLWLNENSAAKFKIMIDQARGEAKKSMGPDHNPIIIAQLTHSGRYSKPEGFSKPLIAQRDPYRDSLIPEQKPNTGKDSNVTDDCIVSDEYLDKLQHSFVKAAKLAIEAGFDGVDVKACHGYLVNELLASRNRSGKYGGSFENRTRFLLEVITKIKAEIGGDKLICSRLGFYDAIPYPFGWGVDEKDYQKPDLAEPKKLVKLMSDLGVKMINFTIANPYYNPHVGRPFNQPIKGAYSEPEHPLRGVERLIDIAEDIQKHFPELVLVGTGYSWLRQLMGNVGAASKIAGKITIVGAGRMAFAYPDFAKDLITTGKLDETKVCLGCSACTQLMRDGQPAGCVVRDSKIYGPIFKQGRMNDKANLKRLAQNCLQCQEPTCRGGCPAGIDIPAFIEQFLNGDDRAAYEIIRKVNILPEVCARLCPVEQQCQGSCLQKFIGDAPLPIAGIQKYLAIQANENGWSKLRVPEKSTGKKIAVIGAGPAGLAAAAFLLEAGHCVDIFDKNDRPGGMIQSVIPQYRQCDSLENEIASIFDDVDSERMRLIKNFELTAENNLDKIIDQGYDAVFVGLGLARAIVSADEKITGLYDALEFLRLAKMTSGFDIADKRVAVIGGGNTAMDAAVTAKQLGAKDVYLFYRRSFEQMPAWTAERNNAVEAGVHFMILTQQLGYVSKGNKLTGLRLCPCQLGDEDASGRKKPTPLESSAYQLPFDIAIEAIGQKSPEDIDKLMPGVEFDAGLIKTKPFSFQTSRPKVFAGGDLVHGASTVVAAIADGTRAAKEIDKYLKERLLK